MNEIDVVRAVPAESRSEPMTAGTARPTVIAATGLLPSELKTSDVIRIAALALGLLSTLYPAWRASRVQPAEALRYE